MVLCACLPSTQQALFVGGVNEYYSGNFCGDEQNDGLVCRFASNRYSISLEDIINQFIHLTNYSVNKNCVEYVASSEAGSQDGQK
ncbi:Tubulin polyglutamylase ttll4 [Tyrophagus putrescentiae]|nr:Tubulin polyglutamylase ttll4 [Tyrophagus putrescentiae]